MNIKIFEESQFTRQEKQIIKILELDQDFERLVKEIRKQVNLPLDGLKSELTKTGFKILGTSNDIKEGNEKMNEVLNNNRYIVLLGFLENVYNLPHYWLTTLSSIVMFNVAIITAKNKNGWGKIEIEAINTGLSNISLRVESGHYADKANVVIRIREGMSFDRLIKELRLQKKDLVEKLSKLPTPPNPKITHLDIKKELLRLKPSKTDAELGDYIDKKYQDISMSTDYDNIRKARGRIAKSIEQLHGNKFRFKLMSSLITDSDTYSDGQVSD